ncbi:aminotransferase class V-fold PLP-dependent enzyme [Geodermatophilus sp. YIM 151500]|uniref:pyridoxal-phosphate-dependent aminotransferase family protein n=1 Tax=Geodermatophilus sp. YIM 151500 TaxID=2984531 RepID=UPI0021E4EDAF|nr:aminotransferase class V-fold PLP-dependent enzyme [Geodermatophilus sp. YIM 151500]MCV2490230.1 aminotransferase class V-fold PLP-dependent enzyme [Geodermatophilus sp. YIM 151500]
MPLAGSSTGGRHFLQIPGPTNVPDRVLRAMDFPTIDHRGPEFAALGKEVLEAVKAPFATTGPVIIYPASGTGAWEAALTNTLSPGDKVLCFETGHFATLWQEMAGKLGLVVDFVPGDWRHGVPPEVVEEKLTADTGHEIKAVMAVHNETSTGVASRIGEIRDAIDRAGHPALYLVDTISSLGSIDYRHDDWKVDVTISGSQKGLMLPPGLSFNALSEKAIEASRTAKLPRSYWDWQPILAANANGFWPYTPGTNLLYGLREALKMLHEEGLQNVYARHARHAEATRAAVRGWGLEVLALDEREYSGSLTAVLVPEEHDADAIRKLVLENYDMSLGSGLGKLAGKIFRIGHLGHFNDLTLAGTLAGVQMGLVRSGVKIDTDGLQAALEVLQS